MKFLKYILVILLAVPVMVFSATAPASAVSCAGTPVAKTISRVINVGTTPYVPPGVFVRVVPSDADVKATWKYEDCNGTGTKIRATGFSLKYLQKTPTTGEIPYYVQMTTLHGSLSLLTGLAGDGAETSWEFDVFPENYTWTADVDGPWINVSTQSPYTHGWFVFGYGPPTQVGQMAIQGQYKTYSDHWF